ncbi:zinc metalloprotease [Pseudomonas fluorescens]|uniref:hypothetical protein n=1 Tax=Pseudomonas fluorescens TaxID=294 RepID=UPI000937EDBC|nr:hypothetical protein [Pseudomonas fluorescens]OPB05773.1 hypothetical protein BFW91_21405 [Pseudomonas fluorescens]
MRSSYPGAIELSPHNLPVSDPGPFGVGANNKPSYTTDQAAKHITRENMAFRDRNDDQKVDLTYTVDKRFTAQQQHRVRQAVQSWQDVANITFKEQAGGADGTVNIRSNPGGDGGVAACRFDDGHTGRVRRDDHEDTLTVVAVIAHRGQALTLRPGDNTAHKSRGGGSSGGTFMGFPASGKTAVSQPDEFCA